MGVTVVVATQYVQQLTDYSVIYQFDLHKLAGHQHGTRHTAAPVWRLHW